MSFNKFELKNFSSNENSLLKMQLNDVWKKFMSSFGYQKYYDSREINKKFDCIHKSTTNIELNSISYNSSIKSLFQILSENSILISEKTDSYFLISNNKKGIFLLSEPKIWIMYIIFIDQKLEFNENKMLIIMNLFKEAIKNNCDIISLFEFFLIYISKIDHNDLFSMNSEKIMEIIPKEFIFLYHKKKSILKSIFYRDNFNYLRTSNDFFSTPNSINKQINDDEFSKKNEEFKLDEEKKDCQNNNICLDINNIIIICKDYLNKGFFAIFKKKNNLKENEDEILKNPFINNYYDDEEDEDFCLMPLLNKYNNYDQKMDAEKTLILIEKSIYKNYTYYPHDINIINKL